MAAPTGRTRPNLRSATRAWHSVDVSARSGRRSEEHTSELQSPCNLVCRLLLEKKSTRLHSRHLVMLYAVFCLKNINTLPRHPPLHARWPYHLCDGQHSCYEPTYISRERIRRRT